MNYKRWLEIQDLRNITTGALPFAYEMNRYLVVLKKNISVLADIHPRGITYRESVEILNFSQKLTYSERFTDLGNELRIKEGANRNEAGSWPIVK